MGSNEYVSLKNFAENSIKTNSFNSPGQEEDVRNISLRKAIQEGIDSGIAENFESEKFLEALKKRN